MRCLHFIMLWQIWFLTCFTLPSAVSEKAVSSGAAVSFAVFKERGINAVTVREIRSRTDVAAMKGLIIWNKKKSRF